MAESHAKGARQTRNGSSAAPDWLLIGLLAIAVVLGGGSRYDIVSLVALRPLSAAALTYAVYRSHRTNLVGFRLPLALLGAWIMLAMLQLVPLPPAIWTALPGREAIVASFRATGTAPGWEPLTVIPFATVNTLLALFLPFAVLLLYAESSMAGRRTAYYLVAGFSLASALFGILQVVAGSGQGALYPYAISNEGLPIGFFANRNHQAAVLAASLPAILAIAANRASSSNDPIMWGGRALALGLVVVVVMTGSRAGTALALCALIFGSLLLSPPKARQRREMQRGGRFGGSLAILSKWAAPAILLATAAVVFKIANGTAFQRLADKDGLGDLRFQILPTVLAMIRSSFPFGYGFGTFPWAYEIFEPVQQMQSAYINRAHDDWLELFVDGGVFAAVIAVASVVWLMVRCWSLRRSLILPSGPEDRYRLSASMGIAILVLASLFDYPLRTPAAAAILMVFVGCLAAPRRA